MKAPYFLPTAAGHSGAGVHSRPSSSPSPAPVTAPTSPTASPSPFPYSGDAGSPRGHEDQWPGDHDSDSDGSSYLEVARGKQPFMSQDIAVSRASRLEIHRETASAAVDELNRSDDSLTGGKDMPWEQPKGDAEIVLSCSMADGPPYANPVGTRGYRAPEIILGSTDYDERVDSWALGVIMAELLAGRHPFRGSSDTEHLSEILDLLGTADIKEWSGYDGRRLPGGCQPGSFLRNKYPCPTPAGGRIRGPPALSEAGFEVLSGLLRCNPEKRLSAAQALQHRWFKELIDSCTRCVAACL